MTLDLRQLNAFLTIVSAGSLGRAADMLHITQPALSRTVRRLEQQVGAPLFERHSKGMQLTAVGSALLPHATLLLREAEHATARPPAGNHVQARPSARHIVARLVQWIASNDHAR
jgi:DNA-binding transcriptional LysR family regulator